jgi:hypothetical protein
MLFLNVFGAGRNYFFKSHKLRFDGSLKGLFYLKDEFFTQLAVLTARPKKNAASAIELFSFDEHWLLNSCFDYLDSDSKRQFLPLKTINETSPKFADYVADLEDKCKYRKREFYFRTMKADFPKNYNEKRIKVKSDKIPTPELENEIEEEIEVEDFSFDITPVEEEFEFDIEIELE